MRSASPQLFVGVNPSTLLYGHKIYILTDKVPASRDIATAFATLDYLRYILCVWGAIWTEQTKVCYAHTCVHNAINCEILVSAGVAVVSVTCFNLLLYKSS